MWPLRRRQRGGRHAGAPAGTTALAPAPAFLPLYAAVPEPPAAVAPAAGPEPTPASAPVPGGGSESGVALVFDDGTAMMLDPSDPRVRVFRAVAGHLTSQ